MGAKIHKKMDSQVYSDISLKCSDQVKTLLNLKKGVKIGGDTVHVDPTILFSRLLIEVERSESLFCLYIIIIIIYTDHDHCIVVETFV